MISNSSTGVPATGNTVDFPIGTTLRPEQAIETCQKASWTDFLGIGITEQGEFEVVNSDMTAERALWIIKWAERWALGLDDAVVEA